MNCVSNNTFATGKVLIRMKNIDDVSVLPEKRSVSRIFFSIAEGHQRHFLILSPVFVVLSRLLRSRCVAQGQGIAVRRVQIFRYVGKMGFCQFCNGARHQVRKGPWRSGSQIIPIRVSSGDPSGSSRIVVSVTVNPDRYVVVKSCCSRHNKQGLVKSFCPHKFFPVPGVLPVSARGLNSNSHKRADYIGRISFPCSVLR